MSSWCKYCVRYCNWFGLIWWSFSSCHKFEMIYSQRSGVRLVPSLADGDPWSIFIILTLCSEEEKKQGGVSVIDGESRRRRLSNKDFQSTEWIFQEFTGIRCDRMSQTSEKFHSPNQNASCVLKAYASARKQKKKNPKTKQDSSVNKRISQRQMFGAISSNEMLIWIGFYRPKEKHRRRCPLFGFLSDK